MRTLRESRERQEQRKRSLERALQVVLKQLEAMGALQVILFGSLTRGEVGLRSDLDLLAVMPSNRSGREWSQEIYTRVERGIACDILVYNDEELEEMLPVSRFLRHVLKEGRVVYEKRTPGRGPAVVDPCSG
jgi:predicted nucleotidyltransferase